MLMQSIVTQNWVKSVTDWFGPSQCTHDHAVLLTICQEGEQGRHLRAGRAWAKGGNGEEGGVFSCVPAFGPLPPRTGIGQGGGPSCRGWHCIRVGIVCKGGGEACWQAWGGATGQSNGDKNTKRTILSQLNSWTDDKGWGDCILHWLISYIANKSGSQVPPNVIPKKMRAAMGQCMASTIKTLAGTHLPEYAYEGSLKICFLFVIILRSYPQATVREKRFKFHPLGFPRKEIDWLKQIESRS